MREEALAEKRAGPRVMVVGAQDSGKSSLCKLLCNYASRQGEQVVLILLTLSSFLLICSLRLWIWTRLRI